jgi:hypothetical protein
MGTAMRSLVFLLTLGGLALAQGGLGTVKTYLLGRAALQCTYTFQVKQAAQRYYDLTKAAGFNYKKLAATQANAVRSALKGTRTPWYVASNAYESMEGIVAGVDMLSDFDKNLDAGTSKAEGGDTVVDFNLTLPNGKVLEKPGNLYTVTEGVLFGSEKSYTSGVAFDVDGDGKIGYGDVLPDANILKAAADLLDEYARKLLETARTWQPTPQDVFKALVVNVPTAGPVFLDRWRSSRFVLGDKATREDFNAISSLQDLVSNIESWRQLYGGVHVLVKAKSASLDAQIQSNLLSLEAWGKKLLAQEKNRRFTPEQAELIRKEGDNRATAITGQITQAAALLDIQVGN